MTTLEKINQIQLKQTALRTFADDLIERLRGTQSAAEYEKSVHPGTEYAKNIGYIEGIEDAVKLLNKKTELEIGFLNIEISRLDRVLQDEEVDTAFYRVIEA